MGKFEVYNDGDWQAIAERRHLLVFSVSGVWNSSPYLGNTLGNTSLANADRAHYTPFLATKKQTITDVSGNVNGAGGTTIRYGIYASNANNEPGELLAQATVDASTLGQKTTAIGPVEVEGLFWVAGVPQGTNVVYAAGNWSINNPIGYETGATPSNDIVGPLYHTLGVSSAMVSNPTLVTESGTLVRFHRVKVRYA
jgi:hypothetical protein